MMFRTGVLAALAAMFAGGAEAQTLRLLTWSGYAPDAVVAAFEKETGIRVEVTLSNNEDMISKLRATGGAGFDLAQPSQDRITGPQFEFGIYKPIDYAKIDTAKFDPSLLAATQAQSTLEGKVYGLAHVWGTYGMVVDTSVAGDVKDFADLCSAAHAGKVSYRLKRPELIAMAFSMGMDPFAAYGDKAKYKEIIEKAGDKLAECKPIVKAYWTGSDDLLNFMRSGEVVAAGAWDSAGFKLNAEDPKWKFVAPASGALGWIDAFALPAKGENDEAAYKWINFVMRPEIAAQIVDASGSFTASIGSEKLANEALRKAFEAAFTPETIAKINWFPPVPAGLEEMEGLVLDRVAAK